MADISRNALFGKLNALAYRGIESATVFCKLRGNPYVELAHWVHQLLQLQDSDLHRIARHFELNASNLARDVTDALDRLPRGSTAISDLSGEVEEAVERGWVFATLMFGEAQVRTGYLIVGLLRTRHLRNALLAISAEFGKIRPEALADGFGEITGGSPEDASACLRRLPDRRRRSRRIQWRHRAGADGQAAGTAAVHRRPDRTGARRQDRSDRRPRRGNPPGRGHPHASPAEQSDAGWRGRGRQDRRGRGLRLAHRRR